MNNEDKILDMLGKLVEGQIELRNDLESTKDILLRMENDHGKKLQALFDAYDANMDSHNQTEGRVTKLEKITEKHSLEIAHLQLAK